MSAGQHLTDVSEERIRFSDIPSTVEEDVGYALNVEALLSFETSLSGRYGMNISEDFNRNRFVRYVVTHPADPVSRMSFFFLPP